MSQFDVAVSIGIERESSPVTVTSTEFGPTTAEGAGHVIDNAERPIYDNRDNKIVGARLKHVVLESGRSQGCGGFIKAGRGDSDPEKPITTTLPK